MKSNKVSSLILVAFFSLLFMSCNNNDVLPDEDKDQDKEPDKTEIIDLYLSPSVPNGRIAIIGSSIRESAFLGAGYDIMGDYLCNKSVKVTVLDLSKIPKTEIFNTTLLSSNSKSYQGVTVKEMLQSILEKNNFSVPKENKGNLLFTGSVTGKSYFNQPYEYSSQFTFICEQYDNTVIRSRVYNDVEKLQSYLSANFIEALELSTPENIIEKFGTHVLTTVHLGRRIRALYRSIVADNEESLLETAIAGAIERQSKIYKTPNVIYNPPKEEAKKNIGGTIIVEFLGGEPKAFPQIALTPNEVIGEPVNIELWLESVNESNSVLTTLSGDDMIPIYDLIADPVQKQEVKEAVSAHIRAKQLDIVETAPIYQVWNGKQHRYFTSYKNFKNSNVGPSSTFDGAIGSLFVKEIPGTVPLYLFSNGKNERFSFSMELTDKKDMQNVGIAGYVYEASQDGLKSVYEISNGVSFGYSSEYKETYGEKKTWKKTGNKFYLKKISL